MIIRAVNTVDAMTATVEDVPFALLQHITNRITHEVEGVNRVVFDLTPKPVGTIEWGVDWEVVKKPVAVRGCGTSRSLFDNNLITVILERP